MGMRRGGEERLIQYILPVAGKLAPRDELGLERMLAAAVTGDDDIVADAAGSCSARWKRNSSALGCISGGNAQLLRSAMGFPAKSRPSFYGRARLRVSSSAIIFPVHSPRRQRP